MNAFTRPLGEAPGPSHSFEEVGGDTEGFIRKICTIFDLLEDFLLEYRVRNAI
jgi:hypothetical protein